MLENIALLVLNVIFVIKMMPPATKMCEQVRRRRDMSDQLTCWKTLLVLNFIFVMKMMPCHKVCVGKLGRGGTCRTN